MTKAAVDLPTAGLAEDVGGACSVRIVPCKAHPTAVDRVCGECMGQRNDLLRRCATLLDNDPRFAALLADLRAIGIAPAQTAQHCGPSAPPGATAVPGWHKLTCAQCHRPMEWLRPESEDASGVPPRLCFVCEHPDLAAEVGLGR
ncbi:MAG: hypothetical protein AABY22_36850 [Nanoarchaeota archaeon]